MMLNGNIILIRFSNLFFIFFKLVVILDFFLETHYFDFQDELSQSTRHSFEL